MADLNNQVRARLLRICMGVLVLGVILGGWILSRRDAPPPQSPSATASPLTALAPAQVYADGYVDPRSCAECHADQHGSWAQSYHSTMTQRAQPTAVHADFDNVRLRAFGQMFHLQQRGDDFSVTLDDPYAPPSTARVERPITLVTGSHHMQVYWFATGKARTLGMLPFVHVRSLNMWMPYPLNMICPPMDVDAYQSAPTGMWNSACIACHTTHGQPKPIDEYAADSAVVALGISCQSCHGPGAAHVAHHRDRAKPAPLIVPARLDHVRGSEVCGRCHSEFEFADDAAMQRYLQEGVAFRPGDRLEDAVAVASLDRRDTPTFKRVQETQPHYFESKFWSDGQTRISGREYNGMILSSCFKAGELSCFSCHQMHQDAADPRKPKQWADDQLALGMRGDKACLQCHETYTDRIVEHTHHPLGSSGASCMNCHMPHTSYGLLKASRSHTIDSPSVSTTLSTGRLNACNLCHLDKTLAWTSDHLRDWYGASQPALSPEDRGVPAVVVQLLRGDAAQRALAAWHLGWDEAHAASDAHWSVPLLVQLLVDPVAAVRLVAFRSIRQHEGLAETTFAPFAPAAERFAAGQALIRQWYAGRTPFNPADLVDLSVDQLPADIIRQLHAQRDDKPLFLGE